MASRATSRVPATGGITNTLAVGMAAAALTAATAAAAGIVMLRRQRAQRLYTLQRSAIEADAAPSFTDPATEAAGTSGTNNTSGSASSTSANPSLATVSSRAAHILANDGTPIYLVNHFVRCTPEGVYDARTNKNGYIGLGIAENKHLLSSLQSLLTHRPEMGLREMGYNNFNGMPHVRELVAHFFSRFIAGRIVAPQNILMTAGANLSLDSLFWCIANPGEYCLLATPYYAAFKADVGLRPGVLIYEVPSSPDNGFRVTVAMYKAALTKARSEGKTVRAVLLCNPNNPLGTILSRDELTELAKWVRSEEGLHLVVDEIYALGAFSHLLGGDESGACNDGNTAVGASTLRAKSPFVSIANVLPTRAAIGDRVHVVYAISKDFGLSGFRCGWIYTENESIIRAHNQLGPFNGLSTDVQHFVYLLFRDDHFLVNFLTQMRAQVARTVTIILAKLTAAAIPFIAPQATLTLWIDLRRWLSEPTREGELELYNDLLRECNVNLVPGNSFHSPVFGFFRLSHSAESMAATEVAIERITRFLQARAAP